MYISDKFVEFFAHVCCMVVFRSSPNGCSGRCRQEMSKVSLLCLRQGALEFNFFDIPSYCSCKASWDQPLDEMFSKTSVPCDSRNRKTQPTCPGFDSIHFLCQKLYSDNVDLPYIHLYNAVMCFVEAHGFIVINKEQHNEKIHKFLFWPNITLTSVRAGFVLCRKIRAMMEVWWANDWTCWLPHSFTPPPDNIRPSHELLSWTLSVNIEIRWTKTSVMWNSGDNQRMAEDCTKKWIFWEEREDVIYPWP